MFVTFSFVTRGQDFSAKMSFWPSIKRGARLCGHWISCANMCGGNTISRIAIANQLFANDENRNDLLIKILFYQFQFVFSLFIVYILSVDCTTFVWMQGEHFKKWTKCKSETRKHFIKRFLLSWIWFFCFGIFVKIHAELPFRGLGACCVPAFVSFPLECRALQKIANLKSSK